MGSLFLLEKHDGIWYSCCMLGGRLLQALLCPATSPYPHSLSLFTLSPAIPSSALTASCRILKGFFPSGKTWCELFCTISKVWFWYFNNIKNPITGRASLWAVILPVKPPQSLAASLAPFLCCSHTEAGLCLPGLVSVLARSRSRILSRMLVYTPF